MNFNGVLANTTRNRGQHCAYQHVYILLTHVSVYRFRTHCLYAEIGSKRAHRSLLHWDPVYRIESLTNRNSFSFSKSSHHFEIRKPIFCSISLNNNTILLIIVIIIHCQSGTLMEFHGILRLLDLSHVGYFR